MPGACAACTQVLAMFPHPTRPKTTVRPARQRKTKAHWRRAARVRERTQFGTARERGTFSGAAAYTCAHRHQQLTKTCEPKRKPPPVSPPCIPSRPRKQRPERIRGSPFVAPAPRHPGRPPPDPRGTAERNGADNRPGRTAPRRRRERQGAT
jgi:hypothetical protein